MSKSPIVYVMGGYLPNGGARMAYEIALTAHQELNVDARIIIVSEESGQKSIFEYPVLFETLDLVKLAGVIRPRDLLICNPSFSDGGLGLRYDCKKLMYVQGFNTFSLLDRWFNRYVAVSGFVREYLKSVYDLEAIVIPPFISPPPKFQDWQSRPTDSLIIYLKGNLDLQRNLLNCLKARVECINPSVAARIAWERSICFAGETPHIALRSLIANKQRFLTLSVAEGFGLVPLEAMASATLVIGFDGFGGRDYLRPGVNCAVQPYPDIEGVALDLVASFDRPDLAAECAARGPSTAAIYTAERFRSAWRPLLRELLTA